MIHVVIADDQAVVRGGLRMILESEEEIEVVGEAADGRQALDLARELDPDVLLMDIQMPTMDGIEATRRLITAQGRARVLVLTTYDLDENVYDALEAGAAGDPQARRPRPVECRDRRDRVRQRRNRQDPRGADPLKARTA